MEKSTKMVEEITEKRKMTQDVKELAHKKIFSNIIIAIITIIYVTSINAIYIYSSTEISNVVLKIFAIIAILITIITFELAYRKDSGIITIFGIEFLATSIIVLCIPKIYENLHNTTCSILILFPIFCAIYYTLKSIIIYKKIEKEYQNNLSDVKEIVKEDDI